MRFRRAASLTILFESGQLAVFNFLTKNQFTCSPDCIEFLSKLDDWHLPETLFDYFPGADRTSLVSQLTQLVEFNALVVEGTQQSELDQKYRDEWQWGAVAGFYHFSVRNSQYIVGEPAREFIRMRKAWRESPQLYQSNSSNQQIINLPKSEFREGSLSLLKKRRSVRNFSSDSITIQVLADCLYAGNGIVGFYDDEDFGRLPMTMTPSGGARNPYELYVYAGNVAGLKPGFYHYSALDHDLGMVREGEIDVSESLADQEWTRRAAANIFLVAHYPRSMWKYHVATAYRVVLMEAGFIGQNIAIAATHHGLSAVPSGALAESMIESYLGVPSIETSVTLSLNIGVPVSEQEPYL